MKKTSLAAFTLCLPLAASAVDLDMSCNSTVRDFFAPLVQDHLISPKPISVSDRSLNGFRPAFFKKLTVYGMRVQAVYGYADEPLLFIKRGEPAGDVYGVAVEEGIANVQAQLSSMNATAARTYRVDGKTTLILCKGT